MGGNVIIKLTAKISSHFQDMMSWHQLEIISEADSWPGGTQIRTIIENPTSIQMKTPAVEGRISKRKSRWWAWSSKEGTLTCQSPLPQLTKTSSNSTRHLPLRLTQATTFSTETQRTESFTLPSAMPTGSKVISSSSRNSYRIKRARE